VLKGMSAVGPMRHNLAAHRTRGKRCALQRSSAARRWLPRYAALLARCSFSDYRHFSMARIDHGGMRFRPHFAVRERTNLRRYSYSLT
jgi:hypothetical protein